VGYFETGLSKNNNKTKAAEEIIPSHQGWNRIGKKIAISQIHQGQKALFSLEAPSGSDSQDAADNGARQWVATVLS
jgi:hypothetical protein